MQEFSMLHNAARLLGTLLVNTIPLIGVLWFGWSVFEVLLLYWAENVLIGAAHSARMAISTRTNAVADGWSTTTFFMMHYGLFTLVHGVFVVVLFGVVAGGMSAIGAGFGTAIFAIVFWQTVALFIDAAATERFKGRTPGEMMFEPYVRVFALHITVLAGGWLIADAGAPVWALAILVGVKSLFDVGLVAFDAVKPGNAATMAALRKRRD